MLDEVHLRRKWAALTRYESQLELARPYFRYDSSRVWRTVRGVQVKTALPRPTR